MTSKPKIGPMLRLVLGVGVIAQPLARPLLRRRLAKGKEDPNRWREKLGQTTTPRPDGPLVWMHGVGVGEVMALRGLIEAMSRQRPDLRFLITSSARSSSDVFAKNLPPRTQHHYLPLDLPKPVRAFLDHWQPDLAVWSDQEIWPRFAVETARRAIPQALVAARITDASAKAKARFGQAYGDLYRLLNARHAQTENTANHMRALMGDDTPVHVTGSLKAAAAPLVDDAALRSALPQSRPIWFAASAHRADIDMALAAQTIATDHVLIIAPRDLADVAHIQTQCRSRNMTFQTKSKGGWPDASTQVFIADTFGEQGTWFRAASATLIGGTFDATQGHNPWEAVALDCPVLHGPEVGNFRADFAQLDAANGARPVHTAKDIATALNDPALGEMATLANAVRLAATAGLTQISDNLLSLLGT